MSERNREAWRDPAIKARRLVGIDRAWEDRASITAWLSFSDIRIEHYSGACRYRSNTCDSL